MDIGATTLLALAVALLACGGKTASDASDASVDASVDGAADVAVDGPHLDAPPGDLAACTGPGQCVLSMNGCCGPCGFPSLADFTAVNEKNVAAFRKMTCPNPELVDCPGCPTSIDKSLMSFCQAGKCAPIDLRTHPLSACTTDADCVLRTSECCECGGDAANPITINQASRAGYEKEVCKPGTGCPECMPSYPAIKPICDATTKHCVIPIRG
ncbi:MAG: hypothetical protein HYV09_18915 [Deltaproteobacteria bacterium]|nr:hypothetical protein [Deltaproteobacteria bacterium]